MKRAGQSQKGLPMYAHKGNPKGAHVPRKRIRFGDIAAAAADGTSVKHATRRAHHAARHRAAPDGSQALMTDRNELAQDETTPMAAGRHRGKATSEHMKRAMELLMKARQAKGKAKKARAKA